MPECMHTSMGARACRAKLGCEVKECVEAEAERERKRERGVHHVSMYHASMKPDETGVPEKRCRQLSFPCADT